eukprot:CAMPEP_0176450240 /NCGR_PEP_ID=MMETSP0127-20121128/27018_1 /TAXON_ID=938130 /ORGANISM="Platyophrya macrostoma, Strain WH" /LENGTH=196 /DNA_ID=CAMNT_0017837857 /DNA_START=35 /DNA_END=625 /DNA_ORIENTATION=+
MDSSTLAATKEMCAYCFDAILHYLDKQEPLPVPDDFPKVDAPLFVTWHINKDELRGCIGTFAKESLSKNLQKFALTSAFKDSRFSPISKKEVKDLNCAVSLLTNFEMARDALDWTVGVHGINISFQDSRQRSYHGTFLPEVAKEQGWDKETTLKYLIKKAGFNGSLQDIIDQIELERYQSSKVSLDYSEYLQMRQK